MKVANVISGVAITWSLLLPFLPTALFALVNNIVGALVLLSVALLSVRYGPIPGVLTVVAVALTFVERNRRRINSIQSEPTLKEQLAPAPPMSTNEVHPAFDEPMEDSSSFVPKDDVEHFSANEKMGVETISSNTGEAGHHFQSRGFGKTDLLS